jgi:multidrug resistance efflux pump
MQELCRNEAVQALPGSRRDRAARRLAPGPGGAPAPPPGAPAVDNPDSRIRIQLVSRDQVDISSEVAAKIASLPFRDGDSFRAGQTLVTLDCSLYNAQLRKAQADADGARDLLDTNRKLLALHSIGALEVQQAQAKQKASAAEVAYMSATVRKCAIAAPFDGRVSSAAPRRSSSPNRASRCSPWWTPATSS